MKHCFVLVTLYIPMEGSFEKNGHAIMIMLTTCASLGIVRVCISSTDHESWFVLCRRISYVYIVLAFYLQWVLQHLTNQCLFTLKNKTTPKFAQLPSSNITYLIRLLCSQLLPISHYICSSVCWFWQLMSEQNIFHCADNLFKCIF